MSRRHHCNRDEACEQLGELRINDLPLIIKTVSIDGEVKNTFESLVSVIPGFANNRYIAVFRRTNGQLVFIDCIRIDFIEFS